MAGMANDHAAAVFLDSQLERGRVPISWLEVLRAFSLFDQFDGFAKGVIDLDHVTYFIFFIVFFLFLTHALDGGTQVDRPALNAAAAQAPARSGATTRYCIYTVVALAAVLFVANVIIFDHNIRWDLTPQQAILAVGFRQARARRPDASGQGDGVCAHRGSRLSRARGPAVPGGRVHAAAHLPGDRRQQGARPGARVRRVELRRGDRRIAGPAPRLRQRALRRADSRRSCKSPPIRQQAHLFHDRPRRARPVRYRSQHWATRNGAGCSSRTTIRSTTCRCSPAACPTTRRWSCRSGRARISCPRNWRRSQSISARAGTTSRSSIRTVRRRWSKFLKKYYLDFIDQVVVDPAYRLTAGEILTTQIPLRSEDNPMSRSMTAPAVFSLARGVMVTGKVGDTAPDGLKIAQEDKFLRRRMRAGRRAIPRR